MTKCETCSHLYQSINDFPCAECHEWDKWESNGEHVEEPDTVNHPSHYCQEGSMECIDEMIAVFGREAVMNFCLLNVWKYRKRAIFKNGVEDLKKADWYMKKYIELKGELK